MEGCEGGEEVGRGEVPGLMREINNILMLEQVLKEPSLGGVDVVVKCKKYP